MTIKAACSCYTPCRECLQNRAGGACPREWFDGGIWWACWPRRLLWLDPGSKTGLVGGRGRIRSMRWGSFQRMYGVVSVEESAVGCAAALKAIVGWNPADRQAETGRCLSIAAIAAKTAECYWALISQEERNKKKKSRAWCHWAWCRWASKKGGVEKKMGESRENEPALEERLGIWTSFFDLNICVEAGPSYAGRPAPRATWQRNVHQDTWTDDAPRNMVGYGWKSVAELEGLYFLKGEATTPSRSSHVSGASVSDTPWLSSRCSWATSSPKASTCQAKARVQAEELDRHRPAPRPCSAED